MTPSREMPAIRYEEPSIQRIEHSDKKESSLGKMLTPNIISIVQIVVPIVVMVGAVLYFRKQVIVLKEEIAEAKKSKVVPDPKQIKEVVTPIIAEISKMMEKKVEENNDNVSQGLGNLFSLVKSLQEKFHSLENKIGQLDLKMENTQQQPQPQQRQPQPQHHQFVHSHPITHKPIAKKPVTTMPVTPPVRKVASITVIGIPNEQRHQQSSATIEDITNEAKVENDLDSELQDEINELNNDLTDSSTSNSDSIPIDSLAESVDINSIKRRLRK